MTLHTLLRDRRLWLGLGALADLLALRATGLSRDAVAWSGPGDPRRHDIIAFTGLKPAPDWRHVGEVGRPATMPLVPGWS